jgi:hypothetical protein
MPATPVLKTIPTPRLKVRVTETEINSAVPKDSGHCMIADAVKAALSERNLSVSGIAVDLQTIRWTDRETGLRYVYLTPLVAQRPLIAFDQGIKPEPFNFELRSGSVVRARLGRKGTKTESVPSRATLVSERRSDNDPDSTTTHSSGVPQRVGGVAPPTGPLAAGSTGRRSRQGRRREFGLRALGTWKEAAEAV